MIGREVRGKTDEPPRSSKSRGFVYLLHFDRPIGNPDNPRAMAQHYLGWAAILSSRLRDHRSGSGAAITKALRDQGIDFTLVRVWKAGRTFERELKNRKKARQLCPFCKARGHQSCSHLSQKTSP